MVEALAAEGHPVWLASYGYGDGPWPADVGRVPVPALPGNRSWASGPSLGKIADDAALAAALGVFLSRVDVDVVHAHNVEAPLAAWLGRTLARKRVPVVYNLHTSLEEELPVYLSGERSRSLATRFGRRVDRELAQRADACVAISRRAERMLEAWGAQRVAYLPPGVDPEEPTGGDADRARARWELGEGPWVVYTGNADAYQDLDVLYAAMAQVDAAGLLVVTGSEVEDVRRDAMAAGIPRERLRVVGSRDFDDVRDALAVAALAALPRQVCAGFPIKLLNALAAGVVTVCAAGSAQPIEGVVTVADGDPAAMAASIRGLLRSPSMTARLGDGAARAIRARWTWRRRAGELARFYESLLS